MANRTANKTANSAKTAKQTVRKQKNFETMRQKLNVVLLDNSTTTQTVDETSKTECVETETPIILTIKEIGKQTKKINGVSVAFEYDKRSLEFSIYVKDNLTPQKRINAALHFISQTIGLRLASYAMSEMQLPHKLEFSFVLDGQVYNASEMAVKMQMQDNYTLKFSRKMKGEDYNVFANEAANAYKRKIKSIDNLVNGMAKLQDAAVQVNEDLGTAFSAGI